MKTPLTNLSFPYPTITYETHASKWHSLALVIMGIIGLIFLGLSLTALRAPGSFIFIVLLSVGVLFSVISILGLIAVAIQSCIQQIKQKKEPAVLPPLTHLSGYPLHEQAMKGDIVEFRFSIQNITADDLEKKTQKEGLTLLHLACLYGKKGIALDLVKKGVDIEAQDNMGQRALHKAAFGGNPDIVHTLLKRGALLDKPDQNGNTALHEIARSKVASLAHSLTILCLLLQAGFNVNAQNNLGQTALHEVVKREDPSDYPLIGLLLHFQAKTEILDGEGNSAYRYAFGVMKAYLENPWLIQGIPAFKQAFELIEKYSQSF